MDFRESFLELVHRELAGVNQYTYLMANKPSEYDEIAFSEWCKQVSYYENYILKTRKEMREYFEQLPK